MCYDLAHFGPDSYFNEEKIMAYKINIGDRQKATKFLMKEQKRWSSRTITFEELAELIEEAEDKLAHLPKKAWKNIRLRLGYDYYKCCSYKYPMHASFIYLTRGASNWFITGLGRESTGYKYREIVEITLPKNLKEEFFKRWEVKNSIKFS